MKHMNFGPYQKTRVSVAVFSFGSKAKMSQIHNLFIKFITYFTIYKKFGQPFFGFGKIWSIDTFDMVKNEEF